VASFGGWECVACTKPSAEVSANLNQTQGEASLCASCPADSVAGNYRSAAIEQLSCFDVSSLRIRRVMVTYFLHTISMPAFFLP